MDPWSKVDYSWIIREASMVVDKLPEVNPPSGRVPGRGLLVLPILEARRRWNRGEIAKKGSRQGGFSSRGINRRRGQLGEVGKGFRGLGKRDAYRLLRWGPMAVADLVLTDSGGMQEETTALSVP